MHQDRATWTKCLYLHTGHLKNFHTLDITSEEYKKVKAGLNEIAQRNIKKAR